MSNKRDVVGKTVDRIVKFLGEKDNTCFLLADETGLGKTVEARRVINRMAKERMDNGKDMFKVLYIASSQLLASENIKKLQKDIEKDIEEISNDRLSTFDGTFNEKDKPVKYMAVTPAVSFLLQGGSVKEKEKCEQLYNDYINNPEKYNNSKVIKEILGRIDQINNLCETLDKELNNANTLNSSTGASKKSDEAIADFINKLESTQEISIAAECINDDAEAIFKKIFENINQKKKLITDVLRPLIPELMTGIEKQPAPDEEKREDVDACLCDLKIINGLYDNNNKVRLRNKEIFKDILREKLNLPIKKSLRNIYLDRIVQQKRLLGTLNGIEKYEPDLVILDEFQNYPRLFTNKEEDDTEDTKNLEKIMQAVLKSGNTDIKVLMLSATPYAYKNMIEIDEDGKTDENEDFFQHIGIDDIISYLNEKNHKKNHKNVDLKKIYKDYRDSIDRLIQDPDITAADELSPEKVAKKVSKTLCELGISRNERPQTVYDRGDTEQSIGNILLKPGDICNEEIVVKIEGENEQAKNVRRFLSTPVYFGKSIEKYDDYNKGLCKYQKIEEFETDYNIQVLKGKKRTRMKALLNDIFPSEDYIPPLFMAPANCEEGKLKGCFSKYNYKEYSKTILFSAYTIVPDLIKLVVNHEFQERIKVPDDELKKLESINPESIDILDINKPETNAFLTYLKEYLGYLEDKGYKFDSEIKEKEIIVKSLLKIFSREFAKQIIIKVFSRFNKAGVYNGPGISDTTVDNYWDRVRTYCEWGCFDIVLDEFFYLFYSQAEEKNLISDYLKTVAGWQELVSYSLSYTSKSGITNNTMKEYKKCFQSPFYPMCFFLSSVAQEGLDFHWYCDTIVHWNAPVSPIALLQREGRINRYDCFSLRKKLRMELKDAGIDLTGKSWGEIFKIAETLIESEPSGDLIMSEKLAEAVTKLKGNEYNGLYPHHLSLDCKALSINRKCYYYPLSEEHFRWMDLMKNMECYRSLLGAWDMTELLSQLDEDTRSKVMERLGSGECMINLTPIPEGNEQ